MPNKWKIISNSKKRPEGMLGRVTDFLERPRGLAAFEVVVPVTQDQRAAAACAPDLAGPVPRSLEAVWTKKTGRLGIAGVTAGEDVPGFQAALKLCYPNCEFGGVRDELTPAWFDIRGRYDIFDASTAHGHAYAMMDGAGAPALVSRICTAVQQADRAWIQFVFQGHDFNAGLDRLSGRMQKFENYLNEPVVRTGDSGGRARTERPREEKNGDFNTHARGIRRHLTERMTGRQVMLSIRGLADGGDLGIDSVLSAVNAAPLETLTGSFEHLAKYSYDISSFYDPEKPGRTWVRIGGRKTHVSRLEAVFERRLLPDPAKFMGRFCDRYCGRNWLGRYHDREPLPFIITGGDLGAMLHLPDPAVVPNMRSTRAQGMPRPYDEKEGFLFGRYV